MSKFSIDQLPMEDFKALGLTDEGQLLLNPKNRDTLLNGQVTSLLHLNNINIDGLGTKSLDAKLSLAIKQDGSVGLYVHPIYKRAASHPHLSSEENRDFSRSGIHTKHTAVYGKIIDYGSAKYQFDEKNKLSYYIELEKFNGETTTIWGVDLERALKASGKEMFDDIQLEFNGKQSVPVEIDGKWEQRERHTWEVKDYIEAEKSEQIVVYEFDKETNSFVALNSEDILVPEEVNGMPLSEQQKQKFKKGQVVELPDGTVVQTSPAKSQSNFLHSNRKLLVASVLLDGGLSFFLVKGIQLIHEMSNRGNQEKQEYNKGYRDALAKIQADLERKSKEYPNDKEILEDLNTVKKEVERSGYETTYSEAEEKSINETKSILNDPELDDNAERREKKEEDAKEQSEKQENSFGPDREINQEHEYKEQRGRGR
ncbi:DUF4099 domain-containing protein [Sphingobacterium siyangense]|uniref:DUF4099 domain-containing protein n=1 Tax=Sphingobacterium siyangense TaxID=459529 RepID=UPI00289CB632|nr:DUF4099 domain-containing protein [Sphingobacterium siyangense]